MRSGSFQYLLLSVFACALLLGAAQEARACACVATPTVLEAIENSDEVVIVKVVSIEKLPEEDKEKYAYDVRSTTMVVEKVFQGKLKPGEEIVVGSGNGADCIWTFDRETIGDQMLLYLRRPENFSDRSDHSSPDPSLWFVSGCGRSRELAHAADDLLYLENIAKRRGKTRISGTIGGWRNPDLEVANKTIKIVGPKKTYQVKTDKNGVFELYDLPPGKYFVEPEMPAGWKIDPDSLADSPSVIRNGDREPEMKSPKRVSFNLEPKKHASINIAFVIENLMRGRVVDPNGKPMPDICVYVVAREQETWDRSGCTDEQGRFEIVSVPEGDYVLVANPDGKPSEREPFQKVFYPGVAERARAVIVTVGAGDTIDNLDIVIPKVAETITVEGVLRHSDGKPAVSEWVKFKVANDDSKIDGNVSVITDDAGRFTMKVLKGLTGELAAEKWLVTDFYKNCPKVDELIAKSGGDDTSVFSNIVKLTAEQNLYGVELMLPFPRCQKKE